MAENLLIASPFHDVGHREEERLELQLLDELELFFDACFTKRRIAEVTGYSPHQVATAIKEGARPRPRPGRPSKSGVVKRREPDTRPAEPWRIPKSLQSAEDIADIATSLATQATDLADQASTQQASATEDQAAAALQASISEEQEVDPTEAALMQLERSEEDAEQTQPPLANAAGNDLSQILDDVEDEDGSEISSGESPRPEEPTQPIEA